MSKDTKRRRHTISMDTLVSLVRGELLVLVGKEGEQSIEIIMDRDERTKSLDDALDLFSRNWECVEDL